MEGPTWSDIADWYDQLVVAGSGPHETAVACLLDLAPPLDGATVIDLACGQGLATRALAAAGAASVTGVDFAPEMLERARGHSTGFAASVSYVHDDAQQLTAFADGTYDGATCQLGLMDIPDLDAALAAVRRVLKPRGWFVFVIGHPCFLAPPAAPRSADDGRVGVWVSGYYDEGFWRSANPHGVRRAGNHHRTLTTYMNALIRAGFQVEAVDEPQATGRLAAERPVYSEVPIFFAARVRRTD